MILRGERLVVFQLFRPLVLINPVVYYKIALLFSSFKPGKEKFFFFIGSS